MRTFSSLLAATLLCLPLAGCIAHGVEMVNKTGRTLKVESLRLNNDGTLTEPYSTSILVPEGQLKHHPPVEKGYAGERVRLSIADSPETPGHSVLLHMPDRKTRDFDIEYIAGRLYIREYKKGRDWSQVGEPNWGE